MLAVWVRDVGDLDGRDYIEYLLVDGRICVTAGAIISFQSYC